VVGINHAANLFACDWAVCLDPQNLRSLIYPPAIGYVWRSAFLGKGEALKLKDRWNVCTEIDAEDRICGWLPEWSLQAALLLLAAFGDVEEICLFGADAGMPDKLQGSMESLTISAPGGLSNNTPERWRKEQKDMARTMEFVRNYGISVKRVKA
jgi:hypothetical protein